MKVVQLHEYTPEQFLSPTLTPKIAHYGPKKAKMTQKLSQHQLNLASISTKLRLNIISTSLQPQPQINLNLNINLNSTSTSTLTSTQYGCDIKATQSCNKK